MKECTWPRGCSATIGSDEKLCTYHAKVTDGFITTTRGAASPDLNPTSTSAAVVEVPLSARERAAARANQEDYFARILEAQQARRNARRDELEEAWDQALGVKRA